MTGDTSVDLAVGGIVLPFIIALINQTTWHPQARGAVAFAVCLLTAAALATLHGTLTLTSWRDSVIPVTGAAMVMYHALWRPSGIVPAVEEATTISARDDPQH